MVGWLVSWFNSQLVGVRVTVRVDVPGHRGAADLELGSFVSVRSTSAIRHVSSADSPSDVLASSGLSMLDIDVGVIVLKLSVSASL